MELTMQTEKVRLTKEKETMLITLYSRAIESRSPDPVLVDTAAEQAIERIDYDFDRIRPSKVQALSVAIRARQFDLWTSDFLSHHPSATVVQLGCGLDSRVYRIDSPPSVEWFDVDYPDVIHLRRQVYPERPGCHLIGSSITEPGWLEELPRDRPAWILAEGVMMYLPDESVKPLLNRLTGHFPGGEMAFDAISRQGVKMARANKAVRATGASFGWGLDHAQDIRQLDPKLELVYETRTPELPGFYKMPASMRAISRFMDLFPSLRSMSRLLRYRF
jgi:methyltransferase (TIGR00027 family)